MHAYKHLLTFYSSIQTLVVNTIYIYIYIYACMLNDAGYVQLARHRGAWGDNFSRNVVINFVVEISQKSGVNTSIVVGCILFHIFDSPFRGGANSNLKSDLEEGVKMQHRSFRHFEDDFLGAVVNVYNFIRDGTR